MLACFNVKENKQKMPLYALPLSNASFSTKFYKAQSDLIGQLTQRRTPQALVGNVTALTIIVSFSFKNKS